MIPKESLGRGWHGPAGVARAFFYYWPGVEKRRIIKTQNQKDTKVKLEDKRRRRKSYKRRKIKTHKKDASANFGLG